jgi:segregation and condensation protein A
MTEPGETEPESLRLRLEGFEGPLDLLLELARGEKLDLGKISVLAIAEQYLAVIEGARRVRLELAADWLVMAAWLAWLKSRLLLPEGAAGAEEAEQAAEDFSARLVELAAVRRAAAWLAGRPQLGQDVFARGMPESFVETDRSKLVAEVPGLMRGYLAAARRATARKPYRPVRPPLFTVQDALERLRRLLGCTPPWSSLEQFLPPVATGLQLRAATASTLLAGLELARNGVLLLRQEAAFGPILLCAADA